MLRVPAARHCAPLAPTAVGQMATGVMGLDFCFGRHHRFRKGAGPLNDRPILRTHEVLLINVNVVTINKDRRVLRTFPTVFLFDNKGSYGANSEVAM